MDLGLVVIDLFKGTLQLNLQEKIMIFMIFLKEHCTTYWEYNYWLCYHQYSGSL